MHLDITQVLVILLGLFAIIGIGFIAGKCKIIPISATGLLGELIMHVSLPCTIFVSMIRPYDPRFFTDGLLMMVLATGFTLVYAVITLTEIRLLNIPRLDRGAWMYSIVFCNAGFVGYPMALALFGAEGLSLAVIFNVPLMLMCFSWGVQYIRNNGKESLAPPKKLWRVIVSECNVSLVLSLICYVNEWTPSDVIMTPATQLGNLTIPLSLLIVGVSLAGSNTKNLLKNKSVFIATAMRLLVFPAITCAILLMIPVSNPIIPVLVMILLATPSPATVSALCASNGGNESLAAQITFMTSLLCMLTIPIWTLFF